MVLLATNHVLTASAGGVPCPESLILGSADKSLPVRVSLSDLPRGQAGKGLQGTEKMSLSLSRRCITFTNPGPQ